MKDFILGVDVDGTLVEHRYPDLGPPVPGAIEWLKKFRDLGIKIILHTMRSRETCDGDMIQPVVDHLAAHDIELYGINNNPTQHTWTTSPKAYCQHFLDDANIGCPLIYPGDGSRPYVDWDEAGPMVMQKFEIHRKKYSYGN